MSFSTTTTTTTWRSKQEWQVCEQSASSCSTADSKTTWNRVLYRGADRRQGQDAATGWEKGAPAASSGSSANIQQRVLRVVLPHNYPRSVSPAYLPYAGYSFLGSIAGSSAMVLSTQALLVAVGVGSHAAAPMAAALNWVVKDGVGQLGGVLFASQLGRGGVGTQSGTADSDPKRWRMLAALALDCSTFLEICTPLLGSHWFLPCASLANVGKNVGFLATSASRAAIHQALARGGALDSNNNLGDITAKAGSQSIIASLLGTALGITLSQTFCSHHGTHGIMAGFLMLSAVHQLCTYNAVKVIPLTTFNRHRLHIVLSSYTLRISLFQNSLNSIHDYPKPLSPSEVASKESFLPFQPPDDSHRWLTIGSSIEQICPEGMDKLNQLLLPRSALIENEIDSLFNNNTNDTHHNIAKNVTNDDPGPITYEKYIVRVHPPNAETNNLTTSVQLTFMNDATDMDILRGMFHSYVIKYHFNNTRQLDQEGKSHSAPHQLSFFTESSMASSMAANNDEDVAHQIMKKSHQIMMKTIPDFCQELKQVGWDDTPGFVSVECGSSRRFQIINEHKLNNNPLKQ